jgi:hypothetical protein
MPAAAKAPAKGVRKKAPEPKVKRIITTHVEMPCQQKRGAYNDGPKTVRFSSDGTTVEAKFDEDRVWSGFKFTVGALREALTLLEEKVTIGGSSGKG